MNNIVITDVFGNIISLDKKKIYNDSDPSDTNSISSWKTESGNLVSLFESDSPWYINKQQTMFPPKNISSVSTSQDIRHSIPTLGEKEVKPAPSKFDFKTIICSLIIVLILIIIVRRYFSKTV